MTIRKVLCTIALIVPLMGLAGCAKEKGTLMNKLINRSLTAPLMGEISRKPSVWNKKIKGVIKKKSFYKGSAGFLSSVDDEHHIIVEGNGGRRLYIFKSDKARKYNTLYDVEDEIILPSSIYPDGTYSGRYQRVEVLE